VLPFLPPPLRFLLVIPAKSSLPIRLQVYIDGTLIPPSFPLMRSGWSPAIGFI
jgi:hypothetical protein